MVFLNLVSLYTIVMARRLSCVLLACDRVLHSMSALRAYSEDSFKMLYKTARNTMLNNGLGRPAAVPTGLLASVGSDLSICTVDTWGIALNILDSA